MNTTATWYRNGVQQSGGYVGCVGYDGGPVVGRFAFTTPATGASSFSFQSSSLTPAGSTTWSGGGSDNYCFAVTTGANDKISAVGGGMDTGSGGWEVSPYMTSNGTKSMSLMPSTTYYLWIWPKTSSYNLWKITSVSISLSGSYGNAGTPSASDGNFGHQIPITITGGSSGAKYTVAVTCAGRSETLQTQGSATIVNWTPNLTTYGALLPSSTAATATIGVKTYYGGTQIGNEITRQIVVRFLESDVGPTVGAGWFAHAPYNESMAQGIAKYIEGISRSAVTFDTSKITTRYSATLAMLKVQCGTSLVTSSPYRTPVLTGQTVITVIATDSRGFSASETYTVTPFAYSEPSLTDVTVYRCDSNGTQTDDGTYFSAEATGVYSSVDGSNSASISLYYRAVGGSYGSATAMTSGTAIMIGGLDPDKSYEIKIVIIDTIGGSGEVVRSIRGQSWAMRFRPGGEGVAFGMSPQGEKRLQVPADWSIYIGEKAVFPAYEVGDIFMTTRSGNPATLLGYGTWTQIKDRFLLAAGDTYTAGDTGGEATHTLTTDELPSHTHGSKTLTGTMNPLAWASSATESGIVSGTQKHTDRVGNSGSNWGDRKYTINATHEHDSVGGGQAHNNMPPYLVVYMWLRTA